VDEAVLIPAADAERLSSYCYKTLKRLHAHGEHVGLVKVGRAVRFHRATLVRWLDTRAGHVTAVA
jgi:NADH/NAD ratio-sensing transcriptional regulator Rex